MNRCGIRWALLVSLLVCRVAVASTYYIDSEAGNDGNDGLSELSPWRSHTMVRSVELQPGDVVKFKCGSAFTGPIHITESGAPENPITLTAYGRGEAPRFTNPSDLDMNGNCIRMSGSYLIVEKLHFHDTPPTESGDRFEDIFPMGAIYNMHGADHNIIRDNTFIKCTKAIQSTGEFTLITKNTMDGPSHPLRRRRPSDKGGWGPMGIQLGIGNQEVSITSSETT